MYLLATTNNGSLSKTNPFDYVTSFHDVGNSQGSKSRTELIRQLLFTKTNKDMNTLIL